MVSPAYAYEAVSTTNPAGAERLFMTRDDVHAKFRAAKPMLKRFRLVATPLYLDFLCGERELDCAAWANPTRNVGGWRGPCYLLGDAHYKTYAELVAATDWSKYGPGNDPRCEHCLMHCGFEPAGRAGVESPLRRHGEDGRMADDVELKSNRNRKAKQNRQKMRRRILSLRPSCFCHFVILYSVVRLVLECRRFEFRSHRIVFALAIEAGCFVDTLSQVRVTRGDGFIVRQGRRGNREVVLVESGPGGHRAAKAAQAMIDAYRPRLMVSAGFAGGLDPRVQRQDLVVATSLTRPPSPSGRGAGGEGGELALDPAALVPWLDEVRNLHRGRLLTFDRVVRLREEKQQLGRQHDALAVDMETFAVAEVCRQRAVDFFAVRAISDAVDDELPPRYWKTARAEVVCRPTRRRGGIDFSASRRREGSLQSSSKRPGVAPAAWPSFWACLIERS